MYLSPSRHLVVGRPQTFFRGRAKIFQGAAKTYYLPKNILFSFKKVEKHTILVSQGGGGAGAPFWPPLRTPITWWPGVDFINAQRTAFTLVDPKNAKNTVKSSVSFYAFRISKRQSCMYNIDEIDTQSMKQRPWATEVYTPGPQGCHIWLLRWQYQPLNVNKILVNKLVWHLDKNVIKKYTNELKSSCYVHVQKVS